MKLETIEFENLDKFNAAIKEILAGSDIYRTYVNADKEEVKKKIISKNRLYVGNNFSLNINKADNGKVYVSIDYFGAEDRIRISKLNNNKSL
jgi:hypothetical protein